MKDQQTTAGTFLAQGIAGGALGGFIYVFLMTLQVGSRDLWSVFLFTPPCMLLGSIIGVIAGSSIWGFHSATGIQIRAATRVSIASVASSLIVVVAGLQFKAVESALTTLLLMTLSFAVPPALLVGSKFRLSDLFSFGTIAGHGDGFGELFELRSDWAIAGMMPLRLLCLGITGVWLLTIAQQPKDNASFMGIVIVSGLPLIYMGVSLFLTFRSPGKWALILLGVFGNIPVILGGLLSFAVYCSFPRNEEFLTLTLICCAFLISWVIFLGARVSVYTSDLVVPSILPDRQGFVRST